VYIYGTGKNEQYHNGSIVHNVKTFLIANKFFYGDFIFSPENVPEKAGITGFTDRNLKKHQFNYYLLTVFSLFNTTRLNKLKIHLK